MRRWGRIALAAFWLCGVAPRPAAARDAMLLPALVAAGGGPADFKALTLVQALAGSDAGVSVAKLVRRFGAPAMKQCIATVDAAAGVVLRNPSLRDATVRLEADSARPSPRALAAALYAAGGGSAHGTVDVERLVENLAPGPLRADVGSDLRARFGTGGARTTRLILQALIIDLRDVYARSPAAP